MRFLFCDCMFAWNKILLHFFFLCKIVQSHTPVEISEINSFQLFSLQLVYKSLLNLYMLQSQQMVFDVLLPT